EQIALLALVCLIIGLATELSLRAFLIHQSDTQIVAASNRAMRGPPPSLELGSHPFHGPGPEFLLNPGNPPGSLGATIVDGQVREAAYLDSAVNQQSVPAVDYPMLAALPANGQCQTLTPH